MTEVRDAMVSMRDKDRVVRLERERGYLLIEAKTISEDPLEPQNEVDHYLLRWRGDDILPTYWHQDDPLAIEAKLGKAEAIEILRKDDMALDL